MSAWPASNAPFCRQHAQIMYGAMCCMTAGAKTCFFWQGEPHLLFGARIEPKTLNRNIVEVLSEFVSKSKQGDVQHDHIYDLSSM